jgi:hypothetical protein
MTRWIIIGAAAGCDGSDSEQSGPKGPVVPCDPDAGTADQHSTPQLDELIEAYEQRSGVTWSAVLDCDDGTSRTVTWSYTAVPRSEIHVTDLLLGTYDDGLGCDLANADTEVEIGGDAVSFVGTLEFDFDPSLTVGATYRSESRRSVDSESTASPEGISTNLLVEPPDGPGLSLGTLSRSLPGDYYCPAVPAVPLVP